MTWRRFYCLMHIYAMFAQCLCVLQSEEILYKKEIDFVTIERKQLLLILRVVEKRHMER